MHAIEKVALYAAAGVALVAALSAHLAGPRAVAQPAAEPPAAAQTASEPTTPSPVPAARAFRLATLDPYLLTERIMGAEDLRKAREDLANQWDVRARDIETQFQNIDQQLQTMAQTDPRAPDLIRSAQQLQADYEQAMTQRQQELERLSAQQLIDAYAKVLQATRAVADRQGYSHVISTRSLDRPIQTTTVGATLQELLARPILKGEPADDITTLVLTELRL